MPASIISKELTSSSTAPWGTCTLRLGSSGQLGKILFHFTEMLCTIPAKHWALQRAATPSLSLRKKLLLEQESSGGEQLWMRREKRKPCMIPQWWQGVGETDDLGMLKQGKQNQVQEGGCEKWIPGYTKIPALSSYTTPHVVDEGLCPMSADPIGKPQPYNDPFFTCYDEADTTALGCSRTVVISS